MQKAKIQSKNQKMKVFCTLICHFDFLSLTFNFQDLGFGI